MPQRGFASLGDGSRRGRRWSGQTTRVATLLAPLLLAGVVCLQHLVALPTAADKLWNSAPTPTHDTTDRHPAISLAFVGDLVFWRLSNVPGVPPRRVVPRTPSPLANVQELLRSDLLVGNLETPVTDTIPQQPPAGTGFRFVAEAADVRELASAGFHALVVANNHWMDLGEDAVRSGWTNATRVLEAHGILPLGAPQPLGSPLRAVTALVKGWRVGIVTANAVTDVRYPCANLRPNPPHGTAEVPEPPCLVTSEGSSRRWKVGNVGKAVGDAVRHARSSGHDVVVAVLHWGKQWTTNVHEYQRRAAHEMIDAGADLVVAHHPHVLQGLERYRNAVIAYSLGSFLWDDNAPGLSDSAVLRASFVATSRGGRPNLREVRLHPTSTVRAKQPRQYHPVPASGVALLRIQEKLVSLSSAFNTSLRVEGGRDVVVALS